MNYSTVETELSRVRSTLERVLAAVPDEQWARKPASGGWSVGEVLAHLIQIETVVSEAGRKVLAQPPRPMKE